MAAGPGSATLSQSVPWGPSSETCRPMDRSRPYLALQLSPATPPKGTVATAADREVDELGLMSNRSSSEWASARRHQGGRKEGPLLAV